MKPSRLPDLTEISIPRGLLFLAVPVWASNFLETSYHIANGIWVGRVGTDALAAMNASAFFVWLVYSQLGVVSTGTSALVANCVGAGRREEAERVARQALALALAWGVALAVLGMLVRHLVLRAMGLEPAVVELGSQYLGVLFLAVPAMAITDCAAAILRGYGDTRTPTVVWGGVLVLNLAMLPFLVLGRGFVPRLGVVGAGVSTAVAMACGVAAYAVLHARGRLPFMVRLDCGLGTEFLRGLGRKPVRSDAGASREAGGKTRVRSALPPLLEVVRIGFPTSLSSSLFAVIYMGLTRVLSVFGTAAVAAVGIGHRIESLAYLMCLSFSAAAVTMVGQNKGAGRLDRAETSAWTAVGFAAVVTGVISLIMITMPVPLARIFSDDPKVVAIAAGYTRWIGLAVPFQSLSVVLEGAFSGAGNTVPPMLISIPLSLLRIPLAWLVAVVLGVGVMGVWWVISALMTVKGLTMGFWFTRGHWKRKRVLQLPFEDDEALGISRAV